MKTPESSSPSATYGTTLNPPYIVTFNGSVACVRDRDGQPVPWLVVDKLMNQSVPSEIADSPAAKNEGNAALRLLAEVADAMDLSLGDSVSVAKMRPLVLARLESVPSAIARSDLYPAMAKPIVHGQREQEDYRRALEAIIADPEADAVAIAHAAITPYTPWVAVDE